MERLKISVAMTTYNGGRFLEEQLESIFHQTMLPSEVVVIDDGSNDNTISILDNYSKSHNLKYYVNAEHLGINKNFEKAIRMTSGDIVFISDQDDVWLKNKIGVMVEAAVKKYIDSYLFNL